MGTCIPSLADMCFLAVILIPSARQELLDMNHPVLTPDLTRFRRFLECTGYGSVYQPKPLSLVPCPYQRKGIFDGFVRSSDQLPCFWCIHADETHAYMLLWTVRPGEFIVRCFTCDRYFYSHAMPIYKSIFYVG